MDFRPAGPLAAGLVVGSFGCMINRALAGSLERVALEQAGQRIDGTFVPARSEHQLDVEWSTLLMQANDREKQSSQFSVAQPSREWCENTSITSNVARSLTHICSLATQIFTFLNGLTDPSEAQQWLHPRRVYDRLGSMAKARDDRRFFRC